MSTTRRARSAARAAAWCGLIHLPLVRPALGGAALLVFVDCLKELPATLLLRPLNVETLPTYIYQFATRGSFEEGALAALLIVAVGILPVIRMVRYADLGMVGTTLRSPRGSTPHKGNSTRTLRLPGRGRHSLSGGRSRIAKIPGEAS